MNASYVPWLQLPGQQNILVQALFTETDYSVRVTDLSNVWSETLNRKKIKARAEELDCPIDAEVNLPDLLERLQNALTVDAKTTKIVLNRQRDQVLLTTTETIGRVKLEWKFQLTALPYSAVACGLTLSLFSMVSYYQRCVQTLLEVIQDKDTLIRQMNDFVKTSNLTFKPNRRQGAFKKFDRLEWLDRCRDKAAREAMDSQEVIDALSLVGRDADFRKDWKSVLTKAGDWQVTFLPDTIEQTPSKVTSSLKKNKKGGGSNSWTKFEEIAAGPDIPHLRKESTTAQAAEFQSPKSKRVEEKRKIHTKWSSPVPSYASSEEDSSVENNVEDNVEEVREQEHESPTPRQRESKKMANSVRDKSESPIEKYRIRDNRESQELESDIDLYNQTPTRPRIVKSLPYNSSSEDTQDESDEELTVKSQTQISEPQITSSPPQTPKKSNPRPSSSMASSIASSPEIKNRIGGTPQKKQTSRVKNLISPKKPQAPDPKSPVELRQESSTVDSQIVDPDAEKKALALKRRAEAERIENSPSKSKLKRARRF